ncbi:MAG: hypothetical protein OEY89_02330 [Gammaproteobacteria bacterium]|nr:hypothetical protein [Gammaproteobacteria bacterium]
MWVSYAVFFGSGFFWGEVSPWGALLFAAAQKVSKNAALAQVKAAEHC